MSHPGSPSGSSPPGHFRTADLLGALSMATDLAVGLSEEHAVRSCYIGMHLADGSGPHGLQGDRIPLTSRIVYATRFLEAFHQLAGRAAAIDLSRRKKGTAFDPAVVDAFRTLSERDEFWAGLEQGQVWPSVLAMEPESAHRFIREEQIDDVGLAFADFADLKSSYSIGHSRRVAERVARQMLSGPAEVANIRRAALMHDIGLVTVPSFVLDRPRTQLTPVEWERLRLHPYHSQRILARVPGLAPLAGLVASHHERLDGQGYYRGLAGAQISSGARILAVADEFDEVCHGAPDGPACEPDEALRRMRDDVGRGLCPDTFQSLIQVLQADGSARRTM